MYRNFYSYNDMPVLKNNSPAKHEQQSPSKPAEVKKESRGILAGFENDDLILIAVFAILLMNNCDDKLLLLAIAFVFFSDYFE